MTSRLGRLLPVAVLAALAEVAAWCQAVLVLQLRGGGATSDFRAYDVAAWIGLHDGWRRIYDTAEQLRVLHARWPGALPLDFLSPPPVAWLAAPLTWLPPGAAFLVFAAVVWLAVMAASQVVAPAGTWWRLGFALAALGLLAAAQAVAFGQVSGIVLLAVAAAWALAERGHDGWAGVALAGIACKPHLAFLVPPALLLAGRLRLFAVFAATAAAIAAAALVSVGPAGLGQMVALATSYTSDPTTRLWSLSTLAGGGPLAVVLQLAAAAAALAVAWAGRRRSPGLAIAAAVTASLLVNVYLHGVDLVLYLVPIWYAARTGTWWLVGAAATLWLALDAAFTVPWIATTAAAALLVLLCAFGMTGAWETTPRTSSARS